MFAFGTVFNAVTVIAGSLTGLVVGRFIPERVKETVFNCLGLFTLVLGLDMALKMKHSLAVLFSLVIGSVMGDMLDLETRANGMGDALKARLSSANPRFTEGFVTATMLFCVGAMAIIGAFEDGLRHDPSILMTKGVMDGIVSIPMAGSLGLGVLCSFIPILVYQGLLTLLSVYAAPFITPDVLNEISGLGGIMIIGIGLNLLRLTKIKLCNMLPGMLFIIPLTMLSLRWAL